MLTPLEAQLYLAEQLPERIGQTKGAQAGETIFIWFNNDVEYHGREDEEVLAPILETEWQQIVLWVEEKMPDEQYKSYQFLIRKGNEIDKCESNDGKLTTWTIVDWRKIISCNYITRATAMKESGL